MGLDFGRWQIRNFRADDTEDLARYANIPTCSATCATLSRIRTPCETPRSKPATEAIVSGNGFRYSDRNLRLWLEREEIPHIMDIKSSERLWTLTDRRLLQVRADRLASGVAESGWVRCSAGNGAKGPRVYDWVAVDTRPQRGLLRPR